MRSSSLENKDKQAVYWRVKIKILLSNLSGGNLPSPRLTFVLLTLIRPLRPRQHKIQRDGMQTKEEEILPGKFCALALIQEHFFPNMIAIHEIQGVFRIPLLHRLL